MCQNNVRNDSEISTIEIDNREMRTNQTLVYNNFYLNSTKYYD